MTSTSDDAMAEFARQREQVETLIRDKVAPAAEDAAGRAEVVARDVMREIVEAVRARPLTAILIAAGIGFVIGRGRH